LQKIDFSTLKSAIALTGGISSGKSTVCVFLKLLGFSIIDADSIAKECLNSSVDELKELFGENIFENGIVNRKKLAEIIFSDKLQKQKLENLLHPKIRAKIYEQALKLENYNIKYIIDIPLFFETKSYDINRVIVVYTPKEVQLNRLVSRDKLSLKEANLRVDAQMDIEAKKELASFVIDNSKDLKHLENEVDRCINWIKELKD